MAEKMIFPGYEGDEGYSAGEEAELDPRLVDYLKKYFDTQGAWKITKYPYPESQSGLRAVISDEYFNQLIVTLEPKTGKVVMKALPAIDSESEVGYEV